MALVAAACGGGNDDDSSGGTGAGQPPREPDRWRNSARASTPTRRSWRRPSARSPSDEASWNIILASIARADQDLDQATIDKAMECFNNQECDTGTGGDIVMGYADGGGDTVNVWRAVSHMEAILQALTYEDIGTIVSTEANFGGPTFDPTIAENDIRFLDRPGRRLHRGLPRHRGRARGGGLGGRDAGHPVHPVLGGLRRSSRHGRRPHPGEDYLTVVGEDLCALGQSFAEVLNTGVGSGGAILGGTPNNALSLGWQQCTIPALADGVDLVNPPPNENTTTGDTFWSDSAIPACSRAC